VPLPQGVGAMEPEGQYEPAMHVWRLASSTQKNLAGQSMMLMEPAGQ